MNTSLLIDEQIRLNVANPYMFEGSNGETAWWIVYLISTDIDSLIFHNIPNEWLVSFWGQSGQDYYEIDFIGPTRDRLLVRTILEQNLDDLKARNVISNYVIRATYVPATDRDTSYETYYHRLTHRNNRMFCL